MGRWKSHREGSEGSEADLETWTTVFTLLKEEYEMMKECYDVTGARLSKLTKIIRTLEEGYVAVYELQLKSGLKFPIFDLLRDVINHYRVLIAQIYPIGICRHISFEMACTLVGVSCSLVLYRQFFQMKGMGGMFYFSSRPKGRDFLEAYAELAGG